MDWYKIVEVDKQNRLKTLFHGINRSRFLETGKWLEAEIKMVKDGTSKTTYLSGWHLLPTLEECKEYLQYFSNQDNKVIIKCKARKLWPKSHSRSNVYLAKHIYIIERCLYE